MAISPLKLSVVTEYLLFKLRWLLPGSTFLMDFMAVSYSEVAFLNFICPLEWKKTLHCEITPELSQWLNYCRAILWILASSVDCGHTMRPCSGYQFVSSAETLGFAVIVCAATNCTSQNMIVSYRILGLIFYSSGNTKEILGMHKANCTVMLNIPEVWTVLKHPSCSLQISQLGWKHFYLLHFYNLCVCYKLAMCKICNWLSETLWGRTQVNSSWRVQNS